MNMNSVVRRLVIPAFCTHIEHCLFPILLVREAFNKYLLTCPGIVYDVDGWVKVSPLRSMADFSPTEILKHIRVIRVNDKA